MSTREIVQVIFKNRGKSMMILSERRPGESKRGHEIRIKGMKKIMIEGSKENYKNKFGGLILR
jgi:hypothetical protein